MPTPEAIMESIVLEHVVAEALAPVILDRRLQVNEYGEGDLEVRFRVPRDAMQPGRFGQLAYVLLAALAEKDLTIINPKVKR